MTAVLQAGLAGLNRYPDAYARQLRRALAERHGVEMEQVVMGNGSCELIMLAGQALLDPGTTIVHADPSFAIYPHLATAAGPRRYPSRWRPTGATIWMPWPLRSTSGRVWSSCATPTTRPGCTAAPMRSSGSSLGLPDDLAILVDEAYFDFVDSADAGRVMSLARGRDNLLVTRTFSKAYGLCGLRVGYGVGSPGWVEAIDKVRQPFNVNFLAQAAALESLRHPSPLAKRVAETVAERVRIESALDAMGVAYLPSRTNFILIDAHPLDGRALHEDLLRRGVIVRDGTALGVPGRLRVTIGAPSENDAFLTALADARAGALAGRVEGVSS